MIEGEYVLAGTGSRSLRSEGPAARSAAASLVENLVRLRRAERGDELIVMSGMAEGFDHLLAVTALKLGIPLWCAIPNKGYGRHYWRDNSVTGRDQFAEFCRIVDAAYRVTYVADGVYVDGIHANFVRNDWMVDQATEFVVWDPTSRGTAHCLKAIRRAGLPYTVLSRLAE